MMRKFSLLILALLILMSCEKSNSEKIGHATEIKRLMILAKVYGYIKYFHPSDEAFGLDWDKFAIYAVDKILKSKTDEKFIETVNELFSPIAPSARLSKSKVESFSDVYPDKPTNVKEYSEYFWHHQGVSFGMVNLWKVYKSERIAITPENDTLPYRPKMGEEITLEVGDNTYLSIPIVVYHNEQGTYPKSNPEKLININSDLENFEVNTNSISFRLGNIINTYNVLQHFYPYFDVVDVDWDKELEKAITKSFLDNTKEEHIVTLKEFTAPLNDGHISIIARGGKNGFYLPPISWEWLENKLILTKLLKEDLGLVVGDEVTKINNINVKDFFKQLETQISAGTKGWMRQKSEKLSLQGEKDSKFTIEVNGKTFEMIRDMDSYSHPEPHRPYEALDSGIHYLNLSLLDMETINYLLPDLERSKGIICDLRGYPNRNHEFITHLLKSNDTTEMWMQIPKIVYPDGKRISAYRNANWMDVMKPKKPYLGDKRIVFITDGSAISYAESYMGFIKGYKLATIIGQPTAGTNGNINRFILPGNIEITWTGMKVVKHDGSQFHGIGILPDMYIEKTIQGSIGGRDEFFEKALEIVRQQ